MPERKSPKIYLDDIVESITRIQRYTRGMDREQFLKDIKTQDAVIRNLEIFGEAVKHLPDSLLVPIQKYHGSEFRGCETN